MKLLSKCLTSCRRRVCAHQELKHQLDKEVMGAECAVWNWSSTCWRSLSGKDERELIIYHSCRDSGVWGVDWWAEWKGLWWTAAQDDRCLETDFILFFCFLVVMSALNTGHGDAVPLSALFSCSSLTQAFSLWSSSKTWDIQNMQENCEIQTLSISNIVLHNKHYKQYSTVYNILYTTHLQYLAEANI